MTDSFNSRTSLDVNGKRYQMFALDTLGLRFDLSRLPVTLKILLENLLRTEDGVNVTAADVEALAGWKPGDGNETEIAFTPARVLMQDFTGVPAVVDLAAMRAAVANLNGDPDRVNPLSPADLVIDHSVMVDHFGKPQALKSNAELEYSRNAERYAFLRWGQTAFSNFRVVPPATGIVHQVNIEYLASVIFSCVIDGAEVAYPDTVVGTDSHTTMVNGLGVLGWGVGGIEAEAAMLGQPVTMLIPEVLGFELTGTLTEGATATDLVLTVVELLRRKGVVGKFVEFFGDGLDHLSLADKATIANMAPEYGATCGFFPIDNEALNYLRLTGRSEEEIALVEAYSRRQGLFRTSDSVAAQYNDTVRLNLAEVVASIAGPKRPQDRIALSEAKHRITDALATARDGDDARGQSLTLEGTEHTLPDLSVVIAAITSCTNTSNPGVIMAAGLLARNAREKGLSVKPWVKTSLAPGSQVVTDYLGDAGLLDDLEEIGFAVVGYGCTTCIGNSGPLPAPVSSAIKDGELIVCSVLSGNRNFEGRVHAEVRMNFLASPPLVVAYALAGTTDIDFASEPIGLDAQGQPVMLSDIWPQTKEINKAVDAHVTRAMFRARYADVFRGDDLWQAVPVSAGTRFSWDSDSTYIRRPPYFDGMSMDPPGIPTVNGARVLALLGDSITTDHISPAGAIQADSPAGEYLSEHGIAPADFNSYGSRRGNHEVMMRGTFANIRLRNAMAPGTEGGWTCLQPSGEQMTIFAAAERYAEKDTPLVVIGGTEYGTGSSRDWAAKGAALLGVKTVLVESFERIHRSNLVGMGVLPLQFLAGQSAAGLGIDGSEVFNISRPEVGADDVLIEMVRTDGSKQEFTARVRIDTPKEWDYYCHGGILPYMVRQLLA
ncbi:MAG: aconitate hydratase AcnA [Acidiferrobacteraceae bacterium]|nr:aconitate hydratase AcnA [Acidiferrobacteraceae bacterium]MDP6398737.1 aconitate hydratase AcnA [Arenicellales bacterium]MDP6551234.1 aconitate hydratase AcnA [Arenicellales bacterium]MDP6790824.1 aconitate hydratase AcnA [Arenicellales bacterium]MDP6918735.1 aconitate hydratase AcnA [Arenicellales bacterium]